MIEHSDWCEQHDDESPGYHRAAKCRCDCHKKPDPRPRDLPKGEALRDRGVARTQAGDPDWATRAAAWIMARLPGARFTADDMTSEIGVPEKGAGIGASMSRAAKAGLIERVGSMRASEVKTNHARRQSVWMRVGNGQQAVRR